MADRFGKATNWVEPLACPSRYPKRPHSWFVNWKSLWYMIQLSILKHWFWVLKFKFWTFWKVGKKISKQPDVVPGPAERRLKSCIDNECSFVSCSSSWDRCWAMLPRLSFSATQSRRIPSHNVRAAKAAKRVKPPSATRAASPRYPFISPLNRGITHR